MRISNVPGTFTFSANGRDCGAASTAVTFFNWRECGATPNGTYTLVVHTASLSPGVYFFLIVETGVPGTNGTGGAFIYRRIDPVDSLASGLQAP